MRIKRGTVQYLQKSELAKIALDLETVAAALATARRACDGHIAALDTFLHGIDDAMSTASAAGRDTRELHDAAVAAARVTLGDVQSSRNGYAATMTAAETAMAAVTGEGVSQPEDSATKTSGVTGADVATGAAGAVAGGAADGVRQTALGLIAESPAKGPGAADPGLLKWLEDPRIGGVELKGFSRVAGVVAVASAVPSVMSDIHDGNSPAEAVTRESFATAAGLGFGALAGDAAAGALAGSVIPGAGTAVGLVVGAGVGALTALGASKGIEALWDPVSDAVGSAVHGAESVFGFG